MEPTLSKITMFLIAAFFFSIFSIAQAENFSDYQLGSGDKISIKVFGEEELSAEFTLSDAGTISYPFLGEIKALDMTIGTLSQLITKELANGYIVNPNVNIEIIGYREFYINGQVESPGAYPYQPGLTLHKAVALAGGYTERASGSKMYVLRDGSSKRNKIRNNAKIQPGDVITIEESFF
ncbi:MAG: polysaccharide export periplasmic protein [Osedax symbiont Rs2]|nr:MAG: polysaccharide export periplasmic protein [Osedax symbiont Rs2]